MHKNQQGSRVRTLQKNNCYFVFRFNKKTQKKLEYSGGDTGAGEKAEF